MCMWSQTMYIVICPQDPHYQTPAHLLPFPWPQFLTTDPTSQIPPPSPIVTNSHPWPPSIRLNYSKPQPPNSQAFWPPTSPLVQEDHNLFLLVSPTGIRAYEQLGQRALGPVGKVVVAMVICLHNVGGEDSGRWRDQLGGRGWGEMGFPRLGWGKWGKGVRENLLFTPPPNLYQPCPVTCSSSNPNSPWLLAPSWKWTLRGE